MPYNPDLSTLTPEQQANHRLPPFRLPSGAAVSAIGVDWFHTCVGSLSDAISELAPDAYTLSAAAKELPRELSRFLDLSEVLIMLDEHEAFYRDNLDPATFGVYANGLRLLCLLMPPQTVETLTPIARDAYRRRTHGL